MLTHVFDPLPQLLKNVRFQRGEPLKDKDVPGSDPGGRKPPLAQAAASVIRKSGLRSRSSA